jgi:predicted Fe-Mo cluster-binding NifX family protein
MTKIAFPTDDGKTISTHFGQAKYFVIATVDASNIVFEQRDKPMHQHGNHEAHGREDNQVQLHEHAPSHNAARAGNMFDVISDCQVLISRGMGQPAFQRAQTNGIQVFLVAESAIDAALQAYQNNALASDLRRVHHTH